jgi:N-acetylglutamate synthase-like GNAT family acetyltransferase
MECNESTFCSLWTEHIKINECTDLFINEKLGDDYFFNRVNNILCCLNVDHDANIAARLVLRNSIRLFSERRLKCFVYIDDSDSVLESILLKNKFTLLDTMQAFRSNIDKVPYQNQSIYVDKIGMDLVPVWIDVFCKSFDALELKSEVQRILKEHFNKLTLLIGYVTRNSSQIPAGCALLFNTARLTGLYCLGTIESFRHQGLATKIIGSSIDIASQQSASLLICQAFTKQGFAEFYKRLGFQLVYKKKIYVLNE